MITKGNLSYYTIQYLFTFFINQKRSTKNSSLFTIAHMLA
jgi:hypothetical protein